MEGFPKLKNTEDDSEIVVNNSSFTIGRSLSCDHIIQSLGISRFHCVLMKNGTNWTLIDRSSNGTFINSKLYKFNESVELHDGDTIHLGPGNPTYTFTKSKIEPIVIEEEIDFSDIAEIFEQPFEVETARNEPQNESPKIEMEPQAEAKESELKEPENEPSDIANDIKKEISQEVDDELMDTELTCSICSELFIKAVTLNCSHSFCRYCIEEWKKTKSTCPICRKCITGVAPTLVLDNFIERYVEKQSEEVKTNRKQIMEQREKVVTNTASSSNVEVLSVIEIQSDYEGSDDYSLNDDDDEDDYEDDDDYYTGNGYYGGYGRCFICNQHGHWANSCPFKRH